MVGIPGLYFVIASDDRARFIRPDPENGLHTIEFVNVGTLFGRDSGPSPVSQEAEPDRFVRLLAARIDEDFSVDLFSHLVLVAPAHLLKELTARMGTPARASLLGSLARDLVTVPDLELWPRLLPWLQPVPNARWPAVPLNR